MTLDTSAIVAILHGESEGIDFAHAVQSARRRLMSAATYVELAAVMELTRDPVSSHPLDDLLVRTGVEIVPVTAEHASAKRTY